MKKGQILDAEAGQTYVLKLVGDVRLTLSTTLEKCIQKMLAARHFRQVVVDLSETDNIDSTSLGMLAKLSMHVQNSMRITPVLVYGSPDIHRVLVSMGFEEQVYHLVDHSELQDMPAQEVTAAVGTESEVQAHVIEAHKALMSLNEQNADAFRDLVCALESGGC